MKQALHFVFSQFGEVVAIYAKKNIHLRGQAFIAYKKLKPAKGAQKQLNGQIFFGKRLVKRLSKH